MAAGPSHSVPSPHAPVTGALLLQDPQICLPLQSPKPLGPHLALTNQVSPSHLVAGALFLKHSPSSYQGWLLLANQK
jgi:hypothetical protein